MKNNAFQTWFEHREANGSLLCDNILDKIETLEDTTEIYNFVESMMLIAWCAGVSHTVNLMR
jgi:hypothetical protein